MKPGNRQNGANSCGNSREMRNAMPLIPADEFFIIRYVK